MVKEKTRPEGGSSNMGRPRKKEAIMSNEIDHAKENI